MMSSDPSASASASQPSVAQLRRPGTGPRRASKTVDLLQPFRRPVTMYNGQPDSENAQGGTLSQFLSMNKAAFFQAVTEGKGQEWTIVMGNEAGDLDTIASSIAYSWLKSMVHQSPTIALIQMSSEDLRLRPENLHAFTLASLDAAHADLFTLSDVPSPSDPSAPPLPTSKFALVDHNQLLPRWADCAPDYTITAVVDHHDDEHLYPDASPRIVEVPTGSCASLVTRLLDNDSAPLPPDLATLLLCAILIDTDGLRPGGKAEAADLDAASFLAPRSVLAPALPLHAPSAAGTTEERPLKTLQGVPALTDLTRTLQVRKFDVGSLPTRDLLRRDYKEYSLLPSWEGSPSPQNGKEKEKEGEKRREKINVGLSTVPVSLKDWLPRDPDFWSATDGWMDERGLTVLGVLTSYRTKNVVGAAGKGKHRRQLLFVVCEPTARPSDETGGGSGSAGSGTSGASMDLDELERRLWAGLEGSTELRCERKEFKKKKHGPHIVQGLKTSSPTDDGASPSKTRRVRLYKQGNVSATRKAVAPLVKSIIEGDGNGAKVA